jgi:lipopolysaccharide O-acetyltransferase
LRGLLFRFVLFFGYGSRFPFYIGRGCIFKNSRRIFLSKGVNIGNYCRIEVFTSLNRRSSLILQDNASLGNCVHIGCANSIVIGKNVLIGSNVLIIDHNHGMTSSLEVDCEIPPKKRGLTSKGGIIIEDNVWIGDGVVVLSGSHIGFGAIIAARCVVRGSISPRSLYKG